MKPCQFTPAQIEYLKHLCTKAAYETTGDSKVTHAFDELSEEGREVVAAAVARRFEWLVKHLGADQEIITSDTPTLIDDVVKWLRKR